MSSPVIAYLEELKNGLIAIWSWLPKAGLFGIGFLIGSAFFKPIVDF